jgi:hypothetical protein
MLIGLIKLVENEGLQNVQKLEQIIVYVNIRTDSGKTVKFNNRPRNLFLVTLFTFKRNAKQAVRR